MQVEYSGYDLPLSKIPPKKAVILTFVYFEPEDMNSPLIDKPMETLYTKPTI
jgi:hypothetical protein